jgi:hypothetical protein
VITNWALATEHILGSPVQFGFYEFLWALGECFAVLAVATHLKPNLKYLPIEGFSLVAHYRQVIIFLVASSILIANSFQDVSHTSVKVVALGVILGCLASIYFSHFLSERN